MATAPRSSSQLSKPRLRRPLNTLGARLPRRKSAPESTSDPTGTEHRGKAHRPRPLKVLTASLAALLVLYAGALFALGPESSGQRLSLDEVVRAVNERRVTSAQFLDQDSRILGEIAIEEEQEQSFWTSYPRSDAATNDLLNAMFVNGTEVTIEAQSGKALVRFVAQFLLPLVILANLFALLFLFARGQGAGSSEFLTFSRIGDRQVRGIHRSTSDFSDVAAADDTVVELAEVVDYLADPKAFESMGAVPPKGVLIVGPPGCGKTLLARAVAGEADAAFFTISASEFVESLVGVGAARVRDLFKQAREVAPAIIFIDEIDAVGRQRGAGLGSGHDEREQTLNELLVQMDGFSPREGVVVLAATNRVDILDPALLRAGRFDRHITVDRPDRLGRLAILRLHSAGKRLLSPEADLPYVAAHTPGFTGADLAGVLNEGALLAVRDRAGAIGRAHLDEAVERVLAGPRRTSTIMGAEDKRQIAYHEAGHVVVAAGLGRAGALDKVSIISRGRGVGHLALLSDDPLLPRRTDMEARIAIAMAGIAAEEMVFGEPSVGAELDLERATDMARDMAGRFGMSSRLGRVRVLQNHKEVFLGRDYLLTREVSQPTLQELDLEVRRILDEQEALAKSILSAHPGVLDAIASALVAQETLHGDQLEKELRGVKASARRPAAAAASAATSGSRSRKVGPTR